LSALSEAHLLLLLLLPSYFFDKESILGKVNLVSDCKAIDSLYVLCD